MDWLNNLLGFSGASSPFGQVGGAAPGAGSASASGAAPSAGPPAGAPGQPGIWGSLFGAPSASTGLQNANKVFGNFSPSAPAETIQQAVANGATPPGAMSPGATSNGMSDGQKTAMKMAMNLLQPKLQPAQMNVLSGPRGQNPFSSMFG
jgi:hypothetical protein